MLCKKQVEYCDGNVKVCPTDTFVAAGTVCRDSAGECDVAETVSEKN